MKFTINNTEYNSVAAFDGANNRFVAPAAGTYLCRASLFYKVNANMTARKIGRLVLNGSTEIKGGKCENSAIHTSLKTTPTLQTLVPLAAGKTVERQAASAPPKAISPLITPSSGLQGRVVCRQVRSPSRDQLVLCPRSLAA